MKNVFFIALLLGIASCSRQNLNYQSSHPEGATQDNTPAPDQSASTSTAQQPDYVSGNGNYNDQINYNAPSYQTFYDELSPYGFWVNNPTYGYVWTPNVGPDFSPYYSNGQWVYSTYGWTWSSNYSWGWAPFHYGRWLQDPMYGWEWVPGYQWAPAWVTWGQTPGYYGWAPIGAGIFPYQGYSPAAQTWCYVPAQNMGQANVSSYGIRSYTAGAPGYENVTLISNQGTYNQAKYNTGPKPNEIETVTGHTITPLEINTTAKPTPNSGTTPGQLSLYRPSIDPATAKAAAPVKVTPVENLKPVNNNKGANVHKANGPVVTPVQQQKPVVPAKPEVPATPQTPVRNEQPQPKPVQQNRPQPRPQPKPQAKPQPKPAAPPQKKNQ